jgi:hypothetical protein
MEDTLITILVSLLPAVLVAVMAFFFFKKFLENESARRSYIIRKDLANNALPNRLQAYERLTLLLERITPVSLIVRTHPGEMTKDEYEQKLILSIEQEYEHNVSQQIYVTESCWNVTRAAKNTLIQRIRQIAMSDKFDTADRLREAILSEGMEMTSPTATALSFIRKEVLAIIQD